MGLKSFTEQFKDTASAVTDKANIAPGGSVGLLVGGGAMALETGMRLSQGQSFGEAASKSVAEDFMYTMAPELLGVQVARMGAEMYPQLKKSAEQNAAFVKNKDFLGGGYVDTQSNYATRARQMEQIKRNRASVSKALGNEAKRYHR